MRFPHPSRGSSYGRKLAMLNHCHELLCDDNFVEHSFLGGIKNAGGPMSDAALAKHARLNKLKSLIQDMIEEVSIFVFLISEPTVDED